MHQLGLLVLAVAGQQVRAQQVEQGVEIGVAELGWGGFDPDDGLGVVAEPADRPVSPGLGVADVVGLVDDDQVEGGRRVQAEQSAPGAPPLGVAHEQGLVQQRIGQDGAGIFLRPDAVQVGLFDAVAQGRAVQVVETLVETLHQSGSGLLAQLGRVGRGAGQDTERPGLVQRRAVTGTSGERIAQSVESGRGRAAWAAYMGSADRVAKSALERHSRLS